MSDDIKNELLLIKNFIDLLSDDHFANCSEESFKYASEVINEFRSQYGLEPIEISKKHRYVYN